MKRFVGLSAFVAMAMLCLVVPAGAKLGVGSTLPKIVVTARPGTLLVLPVIPIYNTGDEPSGYTMNTFALSATETIDPAWVTYSPKAFRLEPNEHIDVRATIDIPSTAEAKEYRAILAAQVVNPTTGVVINAALGPKLKLTVVEGNLFWTAYGYLDRRGPAAFAGVGLLLAALLGIPLALWLRNRASRKRATQGGERDGQSNAAVTLDQEQPTAQTDQGAHFAAESEREHS